MRTLRHGIAFLALGLLGCGSETPWESDSKGAGALFRCAAHVVDGGLPRASAEEEGGLPVAAHSDTEDAGVNAVDWSTQFVRLHADDFRIAVAGKEFLGLAANANLHSDPGSDTYTTFERTWIENGVEMRLFMYFKADDSDWWAQEIRIYDGQARADWLAATGEWFRSPRGATFTGDLDLTLDEPCCAAVGGIPGKGRLTLRGLELQAFPTPEVCRNQRDSYVMEVLYPTIEMTASPSTGFGAGVRLRDQRCQIVDDTSAFAFVWTLDDPALAALTVPDRPTTAELHGLAVGETTLRVTAKRRSDGSVVAEGTMAVIVRSAREN